MSPAVDIVRKALEARGLTADVRSMSAVVKGFSATIFFATQEAFEVAAAKGEIVLTVTLSNAYSKDTPSSSRLRSV
ncbi:MAG: hypothetical protein OEM91_02610 [Hyphomicrobiales bacterium]|nr:hypothetical protein [Hyphomicrobiales bacterium]